MPLIDTRPDNKKRHYRAKELKGDCDQYLLNIGDNFDQISARVDEYSEMVKAILLKSGVKPDDPRLKRKVVKWDNDLLTTVSDVIEGISSLTASFYACKAVNFSSKVSAIQKMERVKLNKGLTLPRGAIKVAIRGSEIARIDKGVVFLQNGTSTPFSNLKLPTRVRVVAGLKAFAVGAIVTVGLDVLIGAITAEIALPKLRKAIKTGYEYRLLLKLALDINVKLYDTIGSHMATIDALDKLPSITVEQIEEILEAQAKDVEKIMDNEEISDFVKAAISSLDRLDETRSSYLKDDWLGYDSTKDAWLENLWKESEVGFDESSEQTLSEAEA